MNENIYYHGDRKYVSFDLGGLHHVFYLGDEGNPVQDYVANDSGHISPFDVEETAEHAAFREAARLLTLRTDKVPEEFVGTYKSDIIYLLSHAVPYPRGDFEGEMVRVPAGRFGMGVSNKQAMELIAKGYGKTLIDLFRPLHGVELPEYWIGKYPVTNVEYQAFVRLSGYPPPRRWGGQDCPRGRDNHPVVEVSWKDAQAYCAWLSQKSGKHCRLPTEAEWEKAARGDDARLYPWGNTFNSALCNSAESGIRGTTPVGKYSRQGDSPFGCADMAGNVEEWCSNHSYRYPYEGFGEQEDMQEDQTRITRGGHYGSADFFVRCDVRHSFRKEDWLGHVGFRVVVSQSTTTR
jgi:formylglycine-generating enzyme required for sulfatase activity